MAVARPISDEKLHRQREAGHDVGKGRMLKRIFAISLGLGLLGLVGVARTERPREVPVSLLAGEPETRHATDVTQAVTVTAEPASAEPAASHPAAQASPCPPEMAWVEGEYCTDVRHDCKRWLDDPKLPFARCGEYAPVAKCVGQRVKMGFCIDKHEYTPPGERVPVNYQSFVSVSKLCKDLGKRICTESEWNFACEGEEMRPYPYGWSREPKCNQDRMDLFTDNPRKKELADRRLPSEELDQCVSPFGVYNMVGNLDEPVLREVARFAYPYRNGLKGGWWMAGRNRCRPATTKHDDHYNDIQVGARCCMDLPGGESGATG
jgi:formylglycine-generating enzyme